MQVQFESDFQKKVLYVSFPTSTVLKEVTQIDLWKKQWVEVLKAWHSPYKAVVDFSNVRIENDSPEFLAAIARLFEFLKRFFLRNVVAWGLQDEIQHFPIELVATEEEALKFIGLRERAPRSSSEDFRSLIHLENHFEQQNVELSFVEPVVLSKDKVTILRSKMTNNLMLWHSHWHLLVDCTNLEIPEESFESFHNLIRFLKGFFLEDVVGYSPAKKDLAYPFQVFRSRHKAAAQVKGSGTESGRDAHCKK